MKNITKYDGQSIFVDGFLAYELGNYLGGGAAGVVYEATDIMNDRAVAVKILNPVGFKLLRPSALGRFSIVRPGVILEDEKLLPTMEDIYWLMNPSSKQIVAATICIQNVLRELTLPQCVGLWGSDFTSLKKLNMKTVFPSVPPKYVHFLCQREGICREVDSMRRVSGHTNVLELYQVLELKQDTKSTIFLVLELAAGGELFDRIRVDEGCDEVIALSYFKQLVDGVAFCHKRGICHRDLKPENLLLADTDDGGTILKIADFGLSATISEDQSTHLSSKFVSVVGSPHYVAPEVLELGGYDGTKADIWSLGVILYAMLAGKLPFGKDVLQCPRYADFRRWHESQSWSSSSMNWFFPRDLSSTVVSLLTNLLHPNPNYRMTIMDAQMDPWIQESPVLEDEASDDDEHVLIFEDDDPVDNYQEFTEEFENFPNLFQAPSLEPLSHPQLTGSLSTSLDDRGFIMPLEEAELPIFNDAVKRSTRFTTAEPATQVLERIKAIVEQNPYHPIKQSHVHQRVMVDYESYKLDVVRENIVTFSVRVFIIKTGVYMVEFFRGRVDIFEFKEFYDDIRQRLSDIVKKDYSLTMLDECF